MILDNATYTVDQFCEALGMTKSAFKTMRQKGLRVLYANSRGFIHASALTEYLEFQGTSNPPGPKPGVQPDHLKSLHEEK